MKKYLFLLFPVMVILLSACSKGYSLEAIEADYVTNRDMILPAEGGTITIKVSSTHSYVMSADPAGSMDFVRNGIVTIAPEGVAIVDMKHDVQVNPNTSGEGRQVRIYARQTHNPDIVTSLLFYQPAQENADEGGEGGENEETGEGE